MTIREAIKSLGKNPDGVYDSSVLNLTIAEDIVPIRVGYPAPKEYYLGMGAGNFYQNNKIIEYPHIRLIVKRGKRIPQEIDLCLED